MKKLLVILFLSFLVGGCESSYEPASITTVIPNVVTKAIDDDSTVNMYVVKTDKAHYYFSSEKELICTYDVQSINISVDSFVFLLVMLFCIGMVMGIKMAD